MLLSKISIKSLWIFMVDVYSVCIASFINHCVSILDDDSRARGEGTSDSRDDMHYAASITVNYACITFTVHRAGHANIIAIHLSNETVTVLPYKINGHVSFLN